MLRPSPNHGTQRLPNDDDDDNQCSIRGAVRRLFVSSTAKITRATNRRVRIFSVPYHVYCTRIRPCNVLQRFVLNVHIKFIFNG